MKIERASEIEIVEIPISHKELLNQAAELISAYSWGPDYPVQPIDEIFSAEYRVGAIKNNQLVGFGTVGRSFSPDAFDNDELWVAHAVVTPAFRKKGIFKRIYGMQLSYAKNHEGRILSCTDNPIMEKFFLENGWKEIRKTKDEADEDSTVFEYNR